MTRLCLAGALISPQENFICISPPRDRRHPGSTRTRNSTCNPEPLSTKRTCTLASATGSGHSPRSTFAQGATVRLFLVSAALRDRLKETINRRHIFRPEVPEIRALEDAQIISSLVTSQVQFPSIYVCSYVFANIPRSKFNHLPGGMRYISGSSALCTRMHVYVLSIPIATQHDESDASFHRLGHGTHGHVSTLTLCSAPHSRTPEPRARISCPAHDQLIRMKRSLVRARTRTRARPSRHQVT
ncbi:hypothetical protein EVG20_g2261 [Dentipellis fragilis]|uniref:Uncharacterized protein n=1 Tax=Dentipellis fragilis TaxID=205917 RepID=A0A4Y9Z783_9AGAM|nr:hypothetical protein EVG20_g2261 [Dentipellis fragilis]